MSKLFIFLLSLFFWHSIFADVVGVISLATKEVIILAANGDQRPGKTGDSFQHEETIITPEGGKTQLLFKDQMTINLSQNSELKIDEFVYSNDTQQENKLTTSIKKGAFKFISGKISDKNPEGMKVKTPKTQIAIRGTSVLGDVKPEAENIVLLDGAIEVASLENPATTQFIDQSGFGVSVDTVSGDIAPPQPVDTTSLNTIFKEVSLTETETSSEAAPAETKESQKLVSTISKSILEEDDSDLNKTFGTKAKEVKTALLKAADSVIAKKAAASSSKSSTSSSSSNSSTSSSSSSSSTSSTAISVAEVLSASPSSTSSQSVSVTVAEVFTTLASQNAEVADAIFKETGSELTNAANVVVTLDVVTAAASGASAPTGAAFYDLTSGRSGSITHTFSNLSLTADTGTGSANIVGSMQIDIDNKQYEILLNGSGTIGGSNFSLYDAGKSTFFGDGDNILNAGGAYSLASDTISDLRFEFSDSIALGGDRASFDVYYTADDYPLGNKDFASMTVDIYTKDWNDDFSAYTVDNRITGTEQITPNR